MDPSLVYKGPFLHASEARSARWALMFPLDEANRVYNHDAEPGDLAVVRAAVVQGMLEGLEGAFAWKDILDEMYPEG
jgi:hypothetical protein